MRCSSKERKRTERIWSILLAATMAIVLTACGTEKKVTAAAETTVMETVAETMAETVKETESQQATVDESAVHPVVTIKMKDGSVIKAELYPEVAPNTVNNFISLIDRGYYNGVIFHRVIKDFMIQGGSPNGTGNGGPGYSIEGEFTDNGFQNNLKHTRGVLSMARTRQPDSAGSQFFIMHGDASYLDGQYAAFGKVIEGMDVVDRIATTATDSSDRPLEDQVMEEVTVETFGVKYPEPKLAGE